MSDEIIAAERRRDDPRGRRVAPGIGRVHRERRDPPERLRCDERECLLDRATTMRRSSRRSVRRLVNRAKRAAASSGSSTHRSVPASETMPLS